MKVVFLRKGFIDEFSLIMGEGRGLSYTMFRFLCLPSLVVVFLVNNKFRFFWPILHKASSYSGFFYRKLHGKKSFIYQDCSSWFDMFAGWSVRFIFCRIGMCWTLRQVLRLEVLYVSWYWFRYQSRCFWIF